MLYFLFRYLKCDLEVFDLHELDCKFDVILIDPPLEEYQRRAPGCNFNWTPWTWDEVCYVMKIVFRKQILLVFKVLTNYAFRGTALLVSRHVIMVTQTLKRPKSC